MQVQQGAGLDQQTALFEKGLSQMAYNVLLNKLPDLVENVVTFKILDTDIDSGTGIGAFIIKRHDQALYIPVVMVDNNIKPLELIYHKGLNIFLPLSKGWLDELDKMSVGELGHGVKTPDTLESDVNIRDVVVPPMVGRFGYAAYVENPRAFDSTEVAQSLGEKTAAPAQPMLLTLLATAPNKVKLGFTLALERSPALLKQAAAVYGVSGLKQALQLRQEKVAAPAGSLFIADRSTKPEELRRVFGKEAADAFSGVRLRGYAARDTRPARNVAVQVQPASSQEQPNQAGVYTVYRPDGKEERAFIVPNPLNPFFNNDAFSRHGTVPGHRGPRPRVFPLGRPQEHNTIPPSAHYLVVLGNGDWMETNKMAGGNFAPAGLADGADVFNKLFTGGGAPRQGRGFFARPKGIGFQATVPMDITDITTGGDGVRRVNARSIGGFEETVLVTAPKSPVGYTTPKGGGFTMLPDDFVWVPLKNELKYSDLMHDPLDVNKFVTNALGLMGSRQVSVKNAGMQQYSINGQPALDRIATIKKLAADYVLDVADADALVEKAAKDYHVRFFPVSVQKLAQLQLQLNQKVAADDDKKKSDKKPSKPRQDSAPDAGGEEVDPEMLAQMQAAAAPPEPPPPSPAELATMEMQHSIDQEMQKLQEKMLMLQQLNQRTQEIAGGAPVAPPVQSAAMGAPPPSFNLATGEPQPGVGMDPSMGGGMDPSMAGGMDPSMGGMDPSMGGGMDPSITGGMPPQMGGGMDPSMAGGMPPQMAGGMDPSMASGMPPQTGGMPPQMGGMDPSMGGGMDPSMAGGMPPQPGMDPSQMGGLDAASMNPAMDPTGQGQMPSAMMTEDGLTEQDIAQQVNPAFLDQAAQLESDDVFDAAAVANLAQSPALKELVGQYVPNLEKALDNLGRVLLSLWMQETTLKSDIGEDTFADLEDNLRTTFKTMGDLVLRLNQSAHVIRGKFDREPVSRT
jgi:hypothetical protein